MMRLKQVLRWLLLHDELFSAEKYAKDESDETDGDTEGDAAEAEEENRDGYLLYRESGLCVRVDLPEGVTRVGRLNSMDCTLTDSGVSGKHAEFTRSPDNHYFVEDCSADGETYLDGTRIAGERQELQPGDTVQIGKVIMEFKRRFPQVIAHPAGVGVN